MDRAPGLAGRTEDHLTLTHAMLSDEDLYDGFPKEKVEAWKKEAQERWGETYVESNRRVRSWSREKLAAVKAEGARITGALGAATDRRPEDPHVQSLVAEFYEHLRHYYEPTPEMFAGLGQMYMDHPDFRARFEGIRPGLSQFLRDAMARYASSRT
jgi:hypothetical protein